MRETIILPGNAGRNYSDVVKARGTTVYLAGQIGRRADGTRGEDFDTQLELALDNMEIALAAAGATVKDVVKVNAYLRDIQHSEAFNTIYGRHFTSERPVRCRLHVGLMSPKSLVELDIIAVID